MADRINRLWSSANGHGEDHPLDKWDQWVVHHHTELVVNQIEDINNMVLGEDEDMGALYVSAGKAMMFAGSQFLFDTMTGVIYGEGIAYPLGEILHNVEQMKLRAHEWVDQVFTQYTAELRTQLENEAEENENEDSDLDAECDREHGHGEDSELEDEESDDSDLEGEWWKEGGEQ